MGGVVISIIYISVYYAVAPETEIESHLWDFPGGAVDKNPPANAERTDLIPSLRRFHTPTSNCGIARVPPLLSPRAAATEACRKACARQLQRGAHELKPESPAFATSEESPRKVMKNQGSQKRVVAII